MSWSTEKWVEQYNYRVKRLSRRYAQGANENWLMDEEFIISEMWDRMPQEAKNLVESPRTK